MDDAGCTPIYAAAYMDKKKCVKMLLDAGADKYIKNKYGIGPLRIAAHKGHDLCIQLLVDRYDTGNPKQETFVNDARNTIYKYNDNWRKKKHIKNTKKKWFKIIISLRQQITVIIT